ncbi:MAG: type I-C CRISPR-associated protein Cas8c/Csd1, partial [Clostridia bacterium]|nr:type I-C CRISPR-associated protein Cas8c/Csd1 [Clostridia bacterium]
TDVKKLDPSSILANIFTDEKFSYLVTTRSAECNSNFKQLQHTILDSVDSDSVRAFLAFIDSIDPLHIFENKKILENKDTVLSGSACVFECNDEYLHKNKLVTLAWESVQSSDSEESTAGTCLVSGKQTTIARTHQKILGVRGAQASGALLVSFNDPSFESYDHSQSYNAPVGDYAMFKYTTALNHLIKDQNTRLNISGDTVVFWGQENQSANNLFNSVCGGFVPTSDTSSYLADQVKSVLNKIRTCKPINSTDIGIDPGEKFHILGLSPNNGRISVRFWYVDTISKLIENAAKHHIDMDIVKSDFDHNYISIYSLLNELIPQAKLDKEVPKQLKGQLVKAVIGGTNYPAYLFSQMIHLMKTEGNVNYVRAAFVKAYLTRTYRNRHMINKEMPTVSLNEESINVPYRLGRLFCALEMVQYDAVGSTKSNINSKYFSSAANTPAIVFPQLLKLAQHHISKSDWGVKSDKLITQILEHVSVFPQHLNLEDQGMFMLGYYQQRKAIYTKKTI